jgi:hypothetical protein
MNARRNISARARKRHVADLDGLLASAVSVASRGGENAPLPKAHARQIDRDLSRLWQHRARKPWKSPEIYEPHVFVI